jgi:hypothetical protein
MQLVVRLVVQLGGNVAMVANGPTKIIHDFIDKGQINLDELQKFLKLLSGPEQRALVNSTRIYLDYILPAFSLIYFVIEAAQVYILLSSLINLTYFKFSKTGQKKFNNGVVLSLTIVNNRLVLILPLSPFRASYKFSVRLYGFVMVIGLIAISVMVGLEGASLYIFAQIKHLDYEEFFLALSAEILRREGHLENYSSLSKVLNGNSTSGVRVATSIAAVFTKKN